MINAEHLPRGARGDANRDDKEFEIVVRGNVQACWVCYHHSPLEVVVTWKVQKMTQNNKYVLK